MPTDKEIADKLAIVAFRNAAESVSRLHLVADFGRKLGLKIRSLLTDNTLEHANKETPDESWVNMTCDAIGSEDPKCKRRLTQ